MEVQNHEMTDKTKFVLKVHTYKLDTIQDFLCNLGMKPHMHGNSRNKGSTYV